MEMILADSDQGRIVLAQRLGTGTSEMAKLVGCSRSTIVSLNGKWMKDAETTSRRQGVHDSELTLISWPPNSSDGTHLGRQLPCPRTTGPSGELHDLCVDICCQIPSQIYEELVESMPN